MSKSALIKAIDAQNINAIKEILAANPELDVNHVTSNGLSALWIAMTPPAGQYISPELIRFLLGSVTDKGEPLIDPTQMYRGKTPSMHLLMIRDTKLLRDYFGGYDPYSVVLNLVMDAENIYVGPRQLRYDAQHLGRLAEDNQNVHDSTVSRLAKINFARLYQHYVLDNGKTLDNAAINSSIQCLEKAIRALKKKPLEQEKAVQMEQGLSFCIQNTTRFALQLESSQKIELNLGEVLALMMHAFNEEDSTLLQLPQGANQSMRDEARRGCIQGVLNTLYDNATTYGLNKASCEGGAFNRFGFALAARHALVLTQLAEPLTGELAKIEMMQFFKQELEQLIPKDRPLYWRVLRAQLINNPTVQEDCRAYLQWIESNREQWSTQLIGEHGVATHEVEQFMATLSDVYPAHYHEATHTLLLFLNLNAHGLRNTLLSQFNTEYSVDDALEQLIVLRAEELQGKPQWHKVLVSHHITPSLDFTVHFLKTYINFCRQNASETLYLTALFQSDNLSERTQLNASKIIRLTAWKQQQEAVCKSYPKQKKWLKRLMQSEQLVLLDTLAEQQPNLDWSNLVPVVPVLIEIALQKGYLRYFNFKGMIFRDRDWRGFDLKGVDFKDAQFINCDLRLIKIQGVRFKGISLARCLLPYFHQTKEYNYYDANSLLWHLVAIKAGLSIQGLFENHSPDYIAPENMDVLVHYKRLDNDTPLIAAVRTRQRNTVRLILKSKLCTEQIVNQRNWSNETAMLLAVRNGDEETVSLLLKSGLCSSYTIYNQRANCLFEAVRGGHYGIVKLLLRSGLCTQMTFMPNVYNNVLIEAVEHRQTKMVKLILKSPLCTQKLINHSCVFHQSALQTATQNGDTKIVRLLLQDQYRNDKSINQTFVWAVRNNRLDILNLLLTHPRCTVGLILDELVYLRTLSPRPLLLATTLMLNDYVNSRAFLGGGNSEGRKHPNTVFIEQLLSEAHSLTAEGLYYKIKEFEASQDLSPQRGFKELIDLIDKFPEEFEFDLYNADPCQRMAIDL